jgi:tetratricopeptide (TPR) repeat protein
LDRAQDALAEYEVVLAMAPHDLAAAHYRLAQAHHALDHRQQTRQHLLAALEIAPHYRDAQRLLLETSAGKCCTDESSNE